MTIWEDLICDGICCGRLPYNHPVLMPHRETEGKILMKQKLLLQNATVYTMQAEPFIGDILLEDGKIAAVGSRVSAPDAEVEDMTGTHIMPGLIDAHCHTGLLGSGSRDRNHNESSNPITPQMRAIDSIDPEDIAFREAVSGGVTTSITGPGSINLIGGTFAAVKNYGNTVEKMLIDPAIAMKAALGENPIFRYTEQKRAPVSRMGVAACIRQALASATVYAPGPNHRDLAMEALQPVLERKMPLKIHCHKSNDIMTAVRICDEFGIRYTLDHCTEGFLVTDALLEALQRNCEGIIIGPLVGYKGKHETSNRIGWDLARVFCEAGIPYAIMTDFYELPTESLISCAAFTAACGVPEDTALKSVTLTAAKIVGLSHRIGSIAPGIDADLAVFSGHPLQIQSKCIRTYIDGRLVYSRT